LRKPKPEGRPLPYVILSIIYDNYKRLLLEKKAPTKSVVRWKNLLLHLIHRIRGPTSPPNKMGRLLTAIKICKKQNGRISLDPKSQILKPKKLPEGSFLG
jgi:hypothetical protein